jgi:hypothetical protein
MRVLALATASALLASSPASAATIQTYKVANWDVGAYSNNNTGRFTHCAASGRYRNGLTLIFSVTEKLDWGISFLNPEWNIREGRVIDIEYQIDNGRVNRATARAVSSRQIVAKLPDSADLFNQFRYGSRLLVSINDGRSVPFNLSDTNAMLTEVLRCANRHKGYVDRGGNSLRDADRGGLRDDGLRSDDRLSRAPTLRDDDLRNDRGQTPPPPSKQGSAPTPDSQAEARDVATDILRRANFNYEVQKPDQLTDDLRNTFDAVWRGDGVLGTLRILSGSRATTIDKVRGEMISSDAITCKGKFASGALPAMSGSQSQTIFTSCEGQSNWSVYYIVVPRKKGGVYLLGISGSGEVAARLQNVANAYRTVALEVLER